MTLQKKVFAPGRHWNTIQAYLIPDHVIDVARYQRHPMNTCSRRNQCVYRSARMSNALPFSANASPFKGHRLVDR